MTKWKAFFIEFITSDIIKALHPTINQESISSLEKMELKNIINEIVYVVVFDEVIHNINAKGKINLTHINNNLMIRGFDDLDINDGNDILDYMNMDTIKAIDQISSFLIALDLYHLYLIDPEKAIYNLTTLPKLTEENIIKDLSNLDVTFYQDGYHNLNKTCKKLLKSYSQE